MSIMDAIEEEYQEKIDKLVAKNERLSQELNGASEMCGGLQAIRKQLQAENEQLKDYMEYVESCVTVKLVPFKYTQWYDERRLSKP